MRRRMVIYPWFDDISILTNLWPHLTPSPFPSLPPFLLGVNKHLARFGVRDGFLWAWHGGMGRAFLSSGVAGLKLDMYRTTHQQTLSPAYGG